MNPIVRGLRLIGHFEGRDTRGQFWPYVGVVMASVFVTWGGVMAFEMNRMMSDMMRFAETHPDQATVHRTPTSTEIRIESGAGFEGMPNFDLFIGMMAVLVGIAVLLLAAAVTRRLHDRGLPGFVGMAPLPFLAFGGYGMRRVMSDVTAGIEFPPLFIPVFINNVVYLAVLGGLVLVLAQAGQPRANRYGPPPEVD